MFENSLKLVDECGLAFLHVFPFSPRPGTPAEKMPQLDGATIKARAAQLRAHGDAARLAFLDSQIGKQISVLVEKTGDSTSEGRAENFARVLVPAAQPSGSLLAMRVSGHNGLMLEGEIL